MTEYHMRITVKTQYIDDYPELLEAYKRQMGAALEDQYGVEPDWDTYRRYDYKDDPIAPEDLHFLSVLDVAGKPKEEA